MPAYLVTELDTKEVDEGGLHVTSKDRVLKQCKVRADVVMVRVTCAAVTCMHQTSQGLFILKQTKCNKDKDETPQSIGVMKLITEMRADRNKIWDSVGLQERFKELVGRCMIY